MHPSPFGCETPAKAPQEIVTGVMGVVFFVVNAAFALVLLILVLISSVYALISKNPDIRYQPMRDDRGSFIKSSSQMTGSTELDALGATARGDMKPRDLEDDRDSFDLNRRSHHGASQDLLPPSTPGSQRAPSHYEVPRSPVDTSVPFFPSGDQDGSRNPYGQQAPQNTGVPLLTPGGVRAPGRAPSPSSQRSHGPYERSSPTRQQDAWNVGVGYDK